MGVVFAHTAPDAWATLIEGLIGAGLVPVASWPIDTEQQNKVSGQGQARLSTSVWMSCRKRDGEAGNAFLGDVMEEMRPVIRDRLLYFWSKGIRGADFFISAIGPALSVFGRLPAGDAPRRHSGHGTGVPRHGSPGVDRGRLWSRCFTGPPWGSWTL